MHAEDRTAKFDWLFIKVKKNHTNKANTSAARDTFQLIRTVKVSKLNKPKRKINFPGKRNESNTQPAIAMPQKLGLMIRFKSILCYNSLKY